MFFPVYRTLQCLELSLGFLEELHCSINQGAVQVQEPRHLGATGLAQASALLLFNFGPQEMARGPVSRYLRGSLYGHIVLEFCPGPLGLAYFAYCVVSQSTYWLVTNYLTYILCDCHVSCTSADF